MKRELFALSVLIIICFSACVPRRYVPPKISLPAFDSAKQFSLELGTFNVGYSLNAGYSLTKHFAIGSGVFNNAKSRRADRTYQGSLVDLPWHPFGTYAANGVNFMLGYYNKFNSNSGFDFFTQYDFERVKGFYVPCEQCAQENYDYKYPGLSLQSSFYHSIKNKLTLVAALKSNVFYDNYFTFDTSYSEIDRIRNYKSNNFLLTPVVQIWFGTNVRMALTSSYTLNLDKRFINEDFYPFSFSLSLSSNFYLKKYHRPYE